MRVIGITGGVGAGKSRILDILKIEYGAQVIQADQVAKMLEEPENVGYQKLIEAFGVKILSKDKTIDREVFARLIFGDEEALSRVNEIIHPLTWMAMNDIIAESGGDLIAIEAALFDANSRQVCDELWLVDASVETRTQRLSENRGYSREKIASIMENQPSREAFMKLCDHVIDNNGTIEMVQHQIRNLLKG